MLCGKGTIKLCGSNTYPLASMVKNQKLVYKIYFHHSVSAKKDRDRRRNKILPHVGADLVQKRCGSGSDAAYIVERKNLYIFFIFFYV
jgi:hypothetical protein